VGQGGRKAQLRRPRLQFNGNLLMAKARTPPCGLSRRMKFEIKFWAKRSRFGLLRCWCKLKQADDLKPCAFLKPL